MEDAYVWVVNAAVRKWPLVMILFAGLTALTGWWYTRLPTGFLPTEDQGYAVLGVQLPDAASQVRTRRVVLRVEEILKANKGVKTWVQIGGNSLLDATTSSNAATFYVPWKPYEERRGPGLSQPELLAALRKEFAKIEEAIVFIFPPPAIQGLGVANGFQIQIEDRSGGGLELLQLLTNRIIQDGRRQSNLAALNSTFRVNVPQIYADIDRVKAKSLDIPLGNIFGALQTALGSAYVNDFNLYDRTYQVRVQADQQFRLRPEDVGRLEVRTRSGKMVPLSGLLKTIDNVGPQIINRYNLYPSASINGEASAGFSSGQALDVMEDLSNRTLPKTFGFEWTAISFQEKRVGSQASWIFGLAVLLVYLVLCGQYESWLLPVAVILVVPLALLGVVAAAALRGMDINIYTQIGIVLIIALASKNAILIVEFAREKHAAGASIAQAAVDAARSRLRPILMTSFAFILGIVPLAVAEGAGAASRQALGTAVLGGMLASTILAVFFVPVFYFIIQSLADRRFRPNTKAPTTAEISE